MTLPTRSWLYNRCYTVERCIASSVSAKPCCRPVLSCGVFALFPQFLMTVSHWEGNEDVQGRLMQLNFTLGLFWEHINEHQNTQSCFTAAQYTQTHSPLLSSSLQHTQKKIHITCTHMSGLSWNCSLLLLASIEYPPFTNGTQPLLCHHSDILDSENCELEML